MSSSQRATRSKADPSPIDLGGQLNAKDIVQDTTTTDVISPPDLLPKEHACPWAARPEIPGFRPEKIGPVSGLGQAWVARKHRIKKRPGLRSAGPTGFRAFRLGQAGPESRFYVSGFSWPSPARQIPTYANEPETTLSLNTTTTVPMAKGPESPPSTNISPGRERPLLRGFAAPLPPNALECGMRQQESTAKASASTPVAPVPASIPPVATPSKLGERLLLQDKMNLLPDACRNLHAACMELAKQGNKCITVDVKQGDYFHGQLDGGTFGIYFEDLHGLFEQVSLESSFLRCWTLYMMTQANQRNDPMGFLDAYVVSATYIGSARDSVIEYVINALQDQQDKDHVMFAYTQGCHWITVVVALRHSEAYYLDSLESGRRDFAPIKEVLGRAFKSFARAGGRTKGSKLTHKNIPCHQQPDSTELCGFYTMYHMELVADFVKKKKDFRDWKCSSENLKTEIIDRMSGYVAVFINGQVINPDGEFHFVPEHKRAKGSPATWMPQSSYNFSRGGQSNTTNSNVRSFSDGSDDENDRHITFTRLEAGENARKSKVAEVAVKMAGIQKQSWRPPMDQKFLEAVRNDEVDNFRILLNLPVPQRPTAYHVNPIHDKVASNNDGATGEVEITSKGLDGCSPSDGAAPPAAGIVPLQPKTQLLLRGVTSDGDGVLHIAARFQRVKVVREIPGSWSYAVNVAAGNKRGETALHYAAATGNVDMISLLLFLAIDDDKKRLLLRMKKKSGETCLHDAVRFGNRDAVKILVDQDARIVVRHNDSHALVRIHDNEGVSPLYLATTLRQIEIVKFLTGKQERVGVQYPAASYYGPGKKTALHAAVLLNKDLSEHLAEWNKELIEKADESGSTPLHLLASTLYKTVVQFSLTDHLPQIMDTVIADDPYWRRTLHSLVSTLERIPAGFFIPNAQVLRNMDTVIMELLLKMDESAGYREDNEGSLPIHVAAANGNLDVVKLLSECRPNCSWSCDNLGQTILHIAVKNGSSNVVDYVCSGNKFAPIFNTRDSNGNTALHLAVLQGDQVIFCRLVRREEVYLTFTNKEERTPLDLAQQSLPSGIALFKGPRQWIKYGLLVAGADYGTYRSDHLASTVAIPDKDKESETISKSAGLVAASAVLILTTAFAAPFTVTNYYSKTETAKIRRVAYRIFVVSDVLAFGWSVVTICFATFSGFPFLHRGTRLFYLPAGVFALRVAAVFLILAFTAGVYVTVSPHFHIKANVIAPVIGCAVAFGAAAPLSAPFLMIFVHARAVLWRLGFPEICRRALDGLLPVWLAITAGWWRPLYWLIPAAWLKALDSRLNRHRLPQQRRTRFRHDGGIGRLHKTGFIHS